MKRKLKVGDRTALLDGTPITITKVCWGLLESKGFWENFIHGPYTEKIIGYEGLNEVENKIIPIEPKEIAEN